MTHGCAGKGGYILFNNKQNSRNSPWKNTNSRNFARENIFSIFRRDCQVNPLVGL